MKKELNCHRCKKDFTHSDRGLPKFCSPECKVANNNQWQREMRDKKNETNGLVKKQCLICNRWYRRVGIHVFSTHNMLARDYREMFGLPLTKGIMAEDDVEKMREYTKKYKSKVIDKNLLKGGRETRYVNGDPRTKEHNGWAHTGNVPARERTNSKYY